MKVSKKIINLETESAFAVLAKANKLISEGKDVINLGIGQPDFPTPINIQEAAIKAIKDGHHGYTPSNGIPQLREAVSEHIHLEYNQEVNPDQILITPGGKPTIFYSSLILGGEKNEIIYPDPGFPIYRSMINFSGAKGVPLNLVEEDNFEINLEKLEQLITKNTSLIIINNPHNPTGGFTEKNVIDKLAKGLKNFPNLVILSDEVYDRLIFDKKEIPTLLNYPDLYERLIVLNGWSKTYAMTGWRLGWGVWPEKLIEHVFKFCVNSHSCVNTPAQYGAIAALEGSEDHLNNMMKEFNKRRKLIVEGLRSLKGVECSMPGGSFFAFPNVKKTGMSGEEFTKICLEKAGVAMIPGTAFGKFATDNVRFNFATSTENISKAIEKIDKIL